jgi:integrase
MLVDLKKAAEARGADPAKVELPHWVLHDLRRTGRTELSRLGVNADIAERVIGHAIGGLRSVYDRYEFLAEKREALARWAAHLQGIIEPPKSAKVVRLGRRERAAGARA